MSASHKNVNATIVGTVPLGTGAATAAKQDTQITAEQAIQTLLGGTGALKDNGPAWTPSRALLSSADASAPADLSAAPTADQKIVIDDWWFSTDTAMRVDLLEETSGTVLWSAYLPANGSVQFTPRDGLKLDTADKKVRRQTSVAGNVRGVLLYHSST